MLTLFREVCESARDELMLVAGLIPAPDGWVRSWPASSPVIPVRLRQGKRL